MTKAEIAQRLQAGDRELVDYRTQIRALTRTLARLPAEQAADLRQELAVLTARVDRFAWDLDRVWEAGRVLAMLSTE